MPVRKAISSAQEKISLTARRLPPGIRETMFEMFVAGHTHGEISKSVGCSSAMVTRHRKIDRWDERMHERHRRVADRIEYSVEVANANTLLVLRNIKANLRRLLTPLKDADLLPMIENAIKAGDLAMILAVLSKSTEIAEKIARLEQLILGLPTERLEAIHTYADLVRKVSGTIINVDARVQSRVVDLDDVSDTKLTCALGATVENVIIGPMAEPASNVIDDSHTPFVSIGPDGPGTPSLQLVESDQASATTSNPASLRHQKIPGGNGTLNHQGAQLE